MGARYPPPYYNGTLEVAVMVSRDISDEISRVIFSDFSALDFQGRQRGMHDE
jgi:hypothetical protein